MWVKSLGQMGRRTLLTLGFFLSTLAQLAPRFSRTLPHLGFMQYRLWLRTMITQGLESLPILALLSFAIGIVLAFQMGRQLSTYGAEIYVVDLIGFSVLREFAPMMAAIIVAGRTASGFTSEIGLMKLNQETDALTVLGVPLSRALILPRLWSLLFIMPLLTIWADVFGITGGLVMSSHEFNITHYEFLLRLQQEVSPSAFFLGLVKAPFFAITIVLVGCYHGLCVHTSAASLGKETTKSVVTAIFWIILLDALASIIFSMLGL